MPWTAFDGKLVLKNTSLSLLFIIFESLYLMNSYIEPVIHLLLMWWDNFGNTDNWRKSSEARFFPRLVLTASLEKESTRELNWLSVNSCRNCCCALISNMACKNVITEYYYSVEQKFLHLFSSQVMGIQDQGQETSGFGELEHQNPSVYWWSMISPMLY